MMRSWLGRGLTMAVMCLVLGACTGLGGNTGGGTQTTVDPSTKQQGYIAPGKFDANSIMGIIQKRGKLRVGVRLDVAPFASKNVSTGAYEGFDIEIAKQIAVGIFGSNIEGKVDFLEYDPNARELALSQNQVDIAVGRYSITVPRKGLVDMAGPYYLAQQQVVVRNERSSSSGTTYRSLIQLNGQKICGVQGSTNFDALKEEIPGADTSVRMQSVNECGAALLQHTVEAVAADSVDLLTLERQAQNSVDTIETTFGDEPYGIGVHKGNTEFRSWINDQLDVRIRKLWKQTFETAVGKELTPTQPSPDRY